MLSALELQHVIETAFFTNSGWSEICPSGVITHLCPKDRSGFSQRIMMQL